MQFDVVSLFPEMFAALTQSGVTRRAHEQVSGACRSGIRAISRATATAPWTIARMAAAPAW
jgi:tRNA G37 N-methylase TrmD